MMKLSGLAASVLASLLFASVANANSVTMTNCDNGSGGSTSGSGGSTSGSGGSTSGSGGSTSGSGGSTTPSNPIVIPANAVFTTPDINYVSHGPSAVLRNGVFSLSINSALGDSLAIDQGKGFSAATGTLILNSGQILESSTATNLSFASGGTVTLIANGQSQLIGQVGALTLTQTAVGYDYKAGIKAVGGSLKTSFANGGGFFGLLYNVKLTGTDVRAGFSANAKGDIAAIKGNPTPAVPEPATLALVTMGLGGLLSAARRRMA